MERTAFPQEYMCTFLNLKLLKCENVEEFTLRTGNQAEGFSNFPPALVNRDDENSTPLPSFEIYDAPDKFDSTFYPWGDYIFGCVLIISGLISLLGNGLAVHVFGKKGRDIAVSEVFLLNIAVVDQFQVCASYLAAIISAFCHRWIFDDIACKIYGAVCYFLGVNFQQHQDRVAVVVDPHRNRQIVKNNEQQIGLLGIQQEQHLTALETINDRNQTQCVTSFNDRLFTSNENQIANQDISVPIDDVKG